MSLARQFMVASLIILVVAAIALAEWVGWEIEKTVVHRTAETTALFVDSFIAPHLQTLAAGETLTPADFAALDRLLDETPLGQHIVAFKVWSAEGKVLYSAEPEAIGQVFPMGEGLAGAWRGDVSSEISRLEDAENILERAKRSELLETYSPVRLAGGDQIIAVAEFYQTVDDLREDIAAAQRRSWLVVGLAMLVIYLLLAGLVGRASDTIESQQAALSRQVTQLKDLLAQNAALHERVRRAAARTTALNERVLRRISAELHDGPVQDVGLALLRLDHVTASLGEDELGLPGDQPVAKDLHVIQSSLQRALGEIRGLSAGLGVPQLGDMSLPDALARAVRVHEQRSQTQVSLDLDGTPRDATLPVKITLYRVIQEALNNAYRHAGGVGQQVVLLREDGRIHVEVSDRGQGFQISNAADWDAHLGLAGMRERVESLGGTFRVESGPGTGTRVIAEVPLNTGEDVYA